MILALESYFSTHIQKWISTSPKEYLLVAATKYQIVQLCVLMFNHKFWHELIAKKVWTGILSQPKQEFLFLSNQSFWLHVSIHSNHYDTEERTIIYNPTLNQHHQILTLHPGDEWKEFPIFIYQHNQFWAGQKNGELIETKVGKRSPRTLLEIEKKTLSCALRKKITFENKIGKNMLVQIVW